MAAYGTVLSLKQTIEESLGSQGSLKTKLQLLSSAQVDMNKDITNLKAIVDKIDQITVTQTKVEQDVADMKGVLSNVAKTVREIKEMMNRAPPVSARKNDNVSGSDKQNNPNAHTKGQNDSKSPPSVIQTPNTQVNTRQSPSPQDVGTTPNPQPSAHPMSSPKPKASPNLSKSTKKPDVPLDLSTTTAKPTSAENTPKGATGDNTKMAPKRDNTTKMNSQTLNLVLSDSLTRDIDEKILDPSGNTQVKSFGGCTVNGLARKVEQFPKSSNVKQVYAHIGFNDSSCINPMTRTSMSLLINGIKMKFPNATLTFSAALPTREGMTKGIKAFNDTCSEVCFNRMVRYVDHSERFLGKRNLYSATENDHVHLGEEGTTLLTSLLRQSLGLETPINIPGLNKTSGSEDKSESQKGEKIETRITREHPTPEIPPSFVHTEPLKYEGGNTFQAFAGACHSLEEARRFKCKVAQEFPDTCNADSVMTAYSFTDKGKKVNKCEDDGERGAGPRMQFLMNKINMENCIIVITRHYTKKIFEARWTAIQDQLCKVASKMEYNIPHDLDIHSFTRTMHYGSYEKRQMTKFRGESTETVFSIISIYSATAFNGYQESRIQFAK